MTGFRISPSSDLSFGLPILPSLHRAALTVRLVLTNGHAADHAADHAAEPASLC